MTDYVVFTLDDPGEVVAEMRRLTSLGHGWVNITPRVPVDFPVPATPGPLAIFSKQGPALPLATWTAPELTRKGITTARIGILHPASRRIAPDLRDSAPPGLILEQDHPRRGLVARVPADVDLTVLVRWLARAVSRYCRLPTEGDFVAGIDTPRRAARA